jgi:UTP-glucose-1-phosphate uridylyltransferase
MKKLTVILPAAGKGTRLNLPYPKEILRLNREKALIDNSFDLFDGIPRNQVEFVIVINEDKTEVVKYLAKYKPHYNVSFTYQHPDELEYTGAIKSARHLFGENNIVLLPDTVLTLSTEVSLAQIVQQHLEKYSFTFLFKSETDEQMLTTKGCLRLNENLEVLAYEDKPSDNLCRFDGYWCAFAFKKQAFDKCIGFMEQSTLNTAKPNLQIENTPIFKSKVIEVEDYKDLGTWDEIVKILAKNEPG